MEPTAKEIIEEAYKIVLNGALNVLNEDPHQWSIRPCSTCKVVSDLWGKPFGCIAWALKRNKNGT